MLIRPAVVADSEAIARVRVDAWKAAYRGLMPDAVLDGLNVDTETGRVRENLAALPPERYFFVGLLEGAGVAGFATGGPCRDADPEYSGELYALYVHPGSQRAGLGRALLAAAAAWLRQQGHKKMLVWVLRDNHPARRFYEAAGWRPDGAEDVYDVGGVGYPEVRYATDL